MENLIIILLILLPFCLIAILLQHKRNLVKNRDVSFGEDGKFNIVSFDIRDYENIEDYRNFIIKYFEKLADTIKKAKKEIIIFDYLVHHHHIKSLRNYMSEEELMYVISLYESYFSSLEEKVKGKDFNYIRVAQLPLDSNKNCDKEKQIEIFLNLVLRETYQHIERIGDNKNFSFYVLKDAIRPFSFMIIDDECYVCEYDRYDKNRRPLPDLLFIDNSSQTKEQSKELITFIKKQKHLIYRILDKNPEANNITNPKAQTTLIDLYNVKKSLLDKQREKQREINEMFEIIQNKNSKRYIDVLRFYIKENIISSDTDEKFIMDLMNYIEKYNSNSAINKEENVFKMSVIKKYLEKSLDRSVDTIKPIKKLTKSKI